MEKKFNIIKYSFAIYAGSIIIQNILATKQIDVGIFTVTTGILISPIVFMIQDVISEIFGYKEAKKMIITGFGMNFVAVLLFTLAIKLPSSQFWENQASFAAILGTTLRISAASFTAYLVGSLTNSKVLVKIKKHYPDKLFVRLISSTVVGQLIDNLLFAFIAFYGILPVPALWSMVIGGAIFEVVYEILCYPVTKKTIQTIKEYIE